MHHLVITGCGRSGTQYMAGVLNGLGLRCSHETVYDHDLDPSGPEVSEQIRDRWKDWHAEASWLAAPLLFQTIPPVTVWHQVRDPLRVIGCWYTHKLLMGNEAMPRFVCKAVPVCGEGDELARCVSYWLRWNKLVQQWGETVGVNVGGYYRYRLEDLTPEHLHCLLKLSHWNFLLPNVKSVMEQAPHTGGCGDHRLVTWPMIAETPDGAKAIELAGEYGYKV